MPDNGLSSTNSERTSAEAFGISAPQITLPKGGGAIRGIGEKFAANPITGTASFSVPIATSPGRSGFGPQLSFSYDSGSGNGPFGFGWSLSLPSITRKTDKGLPRYWDGEESDVFILSGGEDMVPLLAEQGGKLVRVSFDSPSSEPGYTIHPYRPRIEGLFARIERWDDNATGISHWRSVSKDNVTTFYGKHQDARISDPADSTRVYSWTICASFDDKGNAVLYEYKLEDSANVDPTATYESNRLKCGQFAQRYVKRIKYGNLQPNRDDQWNAVDPVSLTDWSFEVVFDYGEHDTAAPTTQEAQTWPVRADPFSTYRPAFEVRTYRLCRRVLMFHHFKDELGIPDCLVRSTDLQISEGPVASFVNSVTQSGYARQPNGTYLKKTLPALAFEYSSVQVDETVHYADPESIAQAPRGVDGSEYQWVDLDSEGLTGVLTEQSEAWLYKRNLGNGTFGPAEVVTPIPSVALLRAGRQQLMDLAGDGSLDLVQLDAPSGYVDRTADGGWDDFTPFKSLPTVDWKNPNLRFVDLTGDGRPDVLISEDTVFSWYPSLGEEGFGPATRTWQAMDEEKGPALVFADGTESIFLADMSADGLLDLVRIRNGEVCYWPNLGYGRFGAKVTMSHAPVFDRGEVFDQKRIRLADLDGSGNADIIYLAENEIRLYFNQSGNAWSAPERLTHFPSVNDLKAVTAFDLLGNGTASLVWSSPLPSDARQPMRYIDLMGGRKPHLLSHISNNMGAETDVQYAASTKFYLQDREEGRAWMTRLPFPVQVIERIESRDLVSNTTLVTSYRYRHGFFDGIEREFRGFAYVEQRDAEALNGQFDLPPVVTKTWFHTGVFLEDDRLEAYFKNPDNSEFFTGDKNAVFLPDSDIAYDLPVDETREAYRALKGSILRQEIYADDGTDNASLPYTVSERSYHVRLLQPRGHNKHTVFFTHPTQSLDYHYEREVADPRISHALTLEVDDYGNVTKSAAVGYGRRQADPDLRPDEREKQTKILVTYSENQVINKPDQAGWYRIGVPVEARRYELTGAKPAAAFFTPTEVAAAAQTAAEIPYEQTADGSLQKRLVENVRTVYGKDNLTGLLPPGQVEPMALAGESYKRALTPGLLDLFQSKLTRAQLTAVLTGVEGRYRDLDSNGSLWAPSGRIFYSPGASDPAQQELAFARRHFFLSHRYQDAFGNDTVITYDDKYKLLIEYTRDALGNETSVKNDLRVLQPRLLTDANANQSEVRFDALGLVVGIAVLGKAAGPAVGDSFFTFAADLSPAKIQAFFNADDPRQLAITHLGTATARIIYDLSRIPVCAASIKRETHVSDLAQGEQPKVQVSFVYSDGFAREAQTKVQAEPGPLDPEDPRSPTLDPRWVGTGAKVYNNKGKPVRQYEPFFSPTHKFGIEQWGVSDTLFYDPVERVVATLHPSHTWQKMVFESWEQRTYDVNDSVTMDGKNDPDIGPFLTKLPDPDYLQSWYEQRINGRLGPDEQDAAQKAAQHADTPTVAYFDTQGRPFLTIADNGEDTSGNTQKYRTRAELDIEGNQRSVKDALDRIVVTYDQDMLGARIHQASIEAGERWMLNNAAGKPIRSWDGRDHQFMTTYDPLQRPIQLSVATGGGQPIVFEKTIYGEGQGVAKNHRGRIYQHFDSSEVVTNVEFDFKGNLLHSTRQFAQDYKATPDWSSSPLPSLDAEIFTSGTQYDALNRPIQLIPPHSDAPNTSINVIQPGYNEANLLERLDLWSEQTAEPVALLDPQLASFHPVTNLDYNAKGQRTLVEYGNGASTAYKYERETFRLARLTTTRTMAAAQSLLQRLTGAAPSSVTSTVQDLSYAYDPAGNITRIRDAAQQTVFFNNQVVSADCDYRYDPVYRLIAASGREHIGQVSLPQTTSNDAFRVNLPQPGDGQAMRNYTEQYVYDAVGNIEQLIHQAANGNWTRPYTYDEPSQLEPGKKSNRLSSTSVGGVVEAYTYDAHGNTTSMPHLTVMQWDARDRLGATSRQAVNDTPPPDTVPETTFYMYDAGGERVRKVTERQNGTRKAERIYLGSSEVYRQFAANGSDVGLKRETLHVMDGKRRIALIEIRTQGDDGSPAQLVRFQLGNHLESANLELDDKGSVISYEEFYPYGSTSYQAVNQSIKATGKRYRYTGKERDEENGFAYHGARYYALWLGRWTAPDPIGIAGGMNIYGYGRCNPILLLDPNGMQPTPRPASGSDPPPPSPPILPEAGAHPQAVLAESEFNAAWEQALAQRYGGSSLQQNLAIFRQRLSEAGDPKGFGAKEYKAVYDAFRNIVSKDPKLSKYNWEGNQLHHIGAKAQAPVPEPERAVDPNNLLFTRGNARSAGTSHNTAQFGENEVRRQQWEASRRASGGAAEPSAPPPKPSAGEPATGDTATPEPLTEAGGGGVTVKGGAAALAPAVATEVGRYFLQKRYDEAAELRLQYKGTPTPQQIEYQRGVGYEFTGRLDKDGRPEWEYRPSLKLRLQNAYHFLFNPFAPVQPSGSWDDPSTA